MIILEVDQTEFDRLKATCTKIKTYAGEKYLVVEGVLVRKKLDVNEEENP